MSRCARLVSTARHLRFLGWIAALGLVVGCQSADSSAESGGASDSMQVMAMDTIKVLSHNLALDICACYRPLLEAIRVTQLPDYQRQPADAKAVHGEKVDSLSQAARLCFSNAKEARGISEIQLQISEEQKRQIEDQLASSLEQECPQVADFLAGKDFY